jgi:hypothetical protein
MMLPILPVMAMEMVQLRWKSSAAMMRMSSKVLGLHTFDDYRGRQEMVPPLLVHRQCPKDCPIVVEPLLRLLLTVARTTKAAQPNGSESRPKLRHHRCYWRLDSTSKGVSIRS